MRIRRYNIDDIFRTLNNSGLFDRTYNQKASFICVPRYNVCIHLRPGSINFFFQYVYKVRTYKTYLVWFCLWLTSKFPMMAWTLNLMGLSNTIISSEAYENLNWDDIDLIYVEWHFFGIFSYTNKTVTHVLAKSAYKERFLNELNARMHCDKFKKLFPKLIRYQYDPCFYEEELAVDAGRQLVDKKQFEKSQKKLKSLNKKTVQTRGFEHYYSQLLKKIGELENEELQSALVRLKENIEEEHLGENQEIELALFHGDFNTGQILIKNKKIKIIDWGDGGFLNRYFDYISKAIYKSPNHSFGHHHFPDDFNILKSYFKKRVKKSNHTNLYVLLTLLEILSVSKGEFESKEGAYHRWLIAVSNNCRKEFSNEK